MTANTSDSDVIRDFNLGDLEAGKVFDKDELVLVRVRDKMITITRSGPAQVMCVYYDIDVSERSVRDSGEGYDQIPEGARAYPIFRQKLEEARLWR